ncbi:hypothetical protein ACFQV8_05620 [Pseudonocardia benzenivorans]
MSDPVGDAVAIGMAELLAAAGHRCTLVTPDPAAGMRLGPGADVSGAHARLLRAGVTIAAFFEVRSAADGVAELVDVHTAEVRRVPCTVVVDCVRRLPDDALWRARPDLPRAGDCVAPRGIQEAVREARTPCAATVATATIAAHGGLPRARWCGPRWGRTRSSRRCRWGRCGCATGSCSPRTSPASPRTGCRACATSTTTRPGPPAGPGW